MKSLAIAIAIAALAAPLAEVCAADLASADEVRAATYDNMSTNRTFDFTATVALPPIGISLPVVDDKGFACVYLRSTAIEDARTLRAGDRIRLTGGVYHSDGNGNNYAQASKIALLGHGEAPKPLRVSPREINSPDFCMRVVTLKGFIADVFRDEIDPQFIFFVLSDGSDSAYLTLSGNPTNELPSHLVGATVEVAGIVSVPRSNTLNRKVQNVLVVIRGIDDIKITAGAPEDPFDVPALYKDGVNIWSFRNAGLRRRRIAGRVLAVWRDKALVRTAEGLVSRVQFAEEPRPKCGASIEAAGIPDTDFFRLNLSRAIWREAAAKNDSPVPTAEPMTAEALLRDKLGNTKISAAHYGHRVTVSGTLAAKPSTRLMDMRAELACGDLRLALDMTSAPHALDDIDVGSTVEATGICVIEAETWRPQTPYPHIQDIFIAVNSADDIRVLARPSWWTVGRLLAVIGALLAALAAVLVWNRSLRRLAERRGRELAAGDIARAEADIRTMERTRLAVELHDSVAQTMNGAIMELKAAERCVTNSPQEMTRHLGIVERTLKSTIGELRNCLWDLRNQSLDEKDFAEAIRRTLLPHTKGVALAVRFSVPREIVTDNTAHTILRVTRELVINAIKHGHAKYIKVAGAVKDKTMMISVTDDGCGFDPENRPGVAEGHFGIQGIRERLRLLAGEISYDAAPGRGTKATVTINLPGEDS
ncbi:MAG: hypothetical protein K6G94_11750 [Kiritimatiellae bacterium]|nr:hypothetical protein [Kiritimatiellia bacterium]